MLAARTGALQATKRVLPQATRSLSVRTLAAASTRVSFAPVLPALTRSTPLRQFSASCRRADEELVKVPSMAESITEGTLKQWLKQKGDFVEADEEVATIETDKVRPRLAFPLLRTWYHSAGQMQTDALPRCVDRPRRLTSPSTLRKPVS